MMLLPDRAHSLTSGSSFGARSDRDRERLVEDKEIGIVRQRLRQLHALTHALL
jgi:hypothetical protein